MVKFMAPECTCERLGGIHQEGCARRSYVDRIAELEAEVERLKAWTDADQPLPEDAEIKAHHPIENRSNAAYVDAQRMVSAKRSKGALVDLVSWLSQRAEQAEAALADMTAERDALYESASAAHTWLSMLSGASADMPVDHANALHKTIRNLFKALEALNESREER